MKELKNAANCVSNQKQKLSRRRPSLRLGRLGRKGLGLPELMVAVASSTVVILGVAVVMNMGMREFATIYEQNKTLESLERASFFLRLYVQNAVNVRACPNAIPMATNTRCPGAPGSVPVDRTTGYIGGTDLDAGAAVMPGFDSDLHTKDGRVIPVGVFLYENGTYSVGTGAAPAIPSANRTADGSMFRAMGIWFQQPQAAVAGRASSGILWIDTNASPAAQGGAVEPSSDDLWFDRMTRLRVQVIPAPADPADPAAPYGPVWQVDFQLTARYYSIPEQRSWFYDVVPTACPLPCRDITRNIRVALRNNALSNSQIASGGTVERSQGSVYYYKLSLPIQGQYVSTN